MSTVLGHGLSPGYRTLQIQHTSGTEQQLSTEHSKSPCNGSVGEQGQQQLLFPKLILRAQHDHGVGQVQISQICVVSCPTGAGCSPSSWWRTSSMLGRS